MTKPLDEVELKVTKNNEMKGFSDWGSWKGEGDPPKYWYATNPNTNESVKVYRSYEDYCMD